MKIFITVFVILLVVVGGTALIAGPQIKESVMKLKPKEDATKVRIQPAAAGTLTETVSAPGEIEPHTNVTIFAEVSARIKSLPYEDGETVKEGDVIMTLDDRDLKAALDSRMAQSEESKFRIESERSRIKGLQNELAYAERDLARQEALYKTGDRALSFLDDARQRVDDIKSRIDASIHTISVMESALAGAQANIARAERDLENTILRAPMDGIITQLNVEVGEAVLGMVSNMGTQIMVIADLSRMLMLARVPESDIASVVEGQTANIHLNAYPDEVFRGTVRKIALQRTTQNDGTGFFETEVEIDLRGMMLRSGLNANVDIEIATHEGFRVESQAIVERMVEDLPEAVTDQDNPLIDTTKRTINAVYCLVDGKAVCTPVKPGPSDLTHSIVLAGLSLDDKVIIGPYKVLEKIKHDDKVMDTDKKDDEKLDDENVLAEGEKTQATMTSSTSSSEGDSSTVAQ